MCDCEQAIQGIYHIDGPLGQVRQMAKWADREGNRVYPDRETLRKIATNLWAAADALDALPVQVTDEMVERAALALWNEGATRREHPRYPHERLIDVTKEDLRAYARVALEAALKVGVVDA